MSHAPWLVSLVLFAGGCTLARGVIAAPGEAGGADAGAEHDAAPEVDADLDGGHDVDAFRPDEDAGPPIDGGGPGDSGTTDAGSDAGTDAGCTPTTEICNGLDDDCNGVVDEVVCRACTAPGTCDDCTRVEAGGRVYQSCPDLTALEYWGRACWTLGSGYDVATIETVPEREAVRAALLLAGLTDAHWIGLDDREANGSYRWIDGTALAWAAVFSDASAPRVVEAFVVLRADGLLDDFPASATHRALCELGPDRCVPSSATDTSCDGRDDDCDGFVDDGCTGTASCTAHVFANSVYYRCTDNMMFTEATAECSASGAALASLDDRFELTFADAVLAGDAWLGLEQAAGAPEPGGGWAWQDGMAFPMSDPDWTAMWDPVDPSGGDSEECAFFHASSGRLHDGVCTNDRTETLCERAIAR